MNEFIGGIFTRGEAVLELEEKASSSKKEVKRLERIVDARDETVALLERTARRTATTYAEEAEDVRSEAARDIELARREVETRVDDVEIESAKEITRAKDEAENRVRRVKEESSHREDIVAKDHAAELKNVELTAEAKAFDEYIAEVDDLKDAVAGASATASAAVARADAKEEVITTLREEFKVHDDLIKYVMTKLPEVDLSKFEINIEVPAPTVVNQKGQGKQEKKKK